MEEMNSRRPGRQGTGFRQCRIRVALICSEEQFLAVTSRASIEKTTPDPDTDSDADSENMHFMHGDATPAIRLDRWKEETQGGEVPSPSGSVSESGSIPLFKEHWCQPETNLCGRDTSSPSGSATVSESPLPDLTFFLAINSKNDYQLRNDFFRTNHSTTRRDYAEIRMPLRLCL